MAASDKGAAKGAQSKRAFRDVVSTPGRRSESPLKKQPKQAVEEGAIGSSNGSNAFNTEMMMAAINAALDTKLDQLAARIENMVTSKIEELERKFENVEDEVKKLKDDVDVSIHHVESVLKDEIDLTWEYAVRNEHYSRKNNLRVLGLVEEEEENLEAKFIKIVEDNLQGEISADEIEIIHRIGARKSGRGEQGSRRDGKPRPVIVKLLSHKSKMKILLKRKMLKGKGLVIAEDMADDIAKRLKELKRKRSVESSWFSNGKIRYKQRDDPRVKEIRSWRDIANIE